ncbi:dihydrolipoyllysine succinyltransferase [Petrotoga mexicana DSM 14811]|uniref:Dihydrolipoyllysine succinyltransferase n=1 Tax=Petrotoga mexicana DSM 14811 TaxID=1122954 RepID=A0A2K1P9N1_9BACT|nr:lipoyl domain-containing protein [Petrotoga mexicana]PNR99416.1 dihydrolipoyllysine succinyltransferase [Petrotoga mexicana DSM 14811]
MSVEIKVPKISEEGKSGVIIRWYRNEGDQVKEGEEICEVMIEKTTLRITAPSSGTLKIVKKDNDEIEEEEVIGFIES